MANIGDILEGGTLYYIWSGSTGIDHGLIAAENDAFPSRSWGCMGTSSMGTPSIQIDYIVIKNPNLQNPDPNIICSGDFVIFSGTTTNAGNFPTFSWWKNDIEVVDVTGLTYASYDFVNGDTIKCIMSVVRCGTSIPVESIPVVLNINSLNIGGITITPTGVTTCSGTTITYTASPIISGAQYQWFVNFISRQCGLDHTYQYEPNNDDLVFCTLNSNVECDCCPLSATTYISNIVTNIVYPTGNIIVEIESVPKSSGSTIYVVDGESINFGITKLQDVFDDTNKTYEWYVNGDLMSTSETYSYTPSNLDEIFLDVKSEFCNNDGRSNIFNVEFVLSNDKSVSVFSDYNNICAGTTVTFSAYQYGYINTQYQWLVNDINVGLNQTTFTSNSLINGDVVKCECTENGDLDPINKKMSNEITMVVYSFVTPSATILLSGGTTSICGSEKPIFYVSCYSNGGDNPSWQWYLNGNEVGYDQQSYQPSNYLTTGDVVKVVLTSSLKCVTGSVDSNEIMMSGSLVVPNVTVSADPICSTPDVVIDLLATGTNGGSTPIYEWYRSSDPGVIQYTGNAWNNVSPYTGVTGIGFESFYCIMTSNATCRTIDKAISEILVYPCDTNLDDGTAIGTGKRNTLNIVTNCDTPDIAARYCYDLDLSGYTDWFLPSKDELNEMYKYFFSISGETSGTTISGETILGFKDGGHWSSSEYCSKLPYAPYIGAWVQGFDGGEQGYTIKVYAGHGVRPIRYTIV